MQHGSSDLHECRVLRPNLVVSAAKLGNREAMILEAMPHLDLLKQRSHIDSPACNSQVGPFHSLNETTSAHAFYHSPEKRRQNVPNSASNPEFGRFSLIGGLRQVTRISRLKLLFSAYVVSIPMHGDPSNRSQILALIVTWTSHRTL